MSSINPIAAQGIVSISGGQDAFLSSVKRDSASSTGGADGESGTRLDQPRRSETDDPTPVERTREGAGVDRAELDEAIEELQEKVEPGRRTLNFSVNDELGDIVVKVVDLESDEVIREIPPEAILAMRERLRDFDQASMAEVLPAGSLLSDIS